VRRRTFITLIGGAVAWPRLAHAQQPSMPVIGFLHGASAERLRNRVSEFQHGLQEAGFFAGQNLTIEYRWAESQYERLPGLAAELARRQVALLFAGSLPAVLAAKSATTKIPIVFTVGGDPVKDGLVASLNRPGGNATGVSLFFGEMVAKRLELLRELVPKAGVIAVLLNSNNPNAETRSGDLHAAARTVGQQVQVFNASSEGEIQTAFGRLAGLGAGALLVGDDPFFESRRASLIALAERHAIPTIYENRDYPAAGGLMSYGARFADAYRQAGIYAGRILKGAKPADLPVMQPTRFELVINLKAAKALGVDVSPTILARADEVIE
jgi:ABC-type uncharacterized transport system substrate-binding protein